MNPRNTILMAFVEHEWRTQFRSPRFLAVSAAYVLLCIVPPWTLFRFEEIFLSIDDIATITALPLPPMTLLMAAALSYDVVFREHNVNAFAITSLTPISSIGFLLRRWVALLTLIVPLTLAGPLSGIAASLNADVPTLVPALFLNSWLIHLVPLAIAASALALAAGTIARSLVGAGILLLLLMIVFNSSVAWALEKFDTVLPSSAQFLGTDPASSYVLFATLKGESAHWFEGLIGESMPLLIERLLPQAILPIGGAFLLLAVAAVYLSRTRPDLRPMVIRNDHPFRSYLRQWNRFRVFLKPDAGFGGRETAAFVISLLLLLAAGAYAVERHAEFLQEARLRYETETAQPPDPTPPTLLPRSATLNATISTDGQIESSGSILFENTDSADVSYLAFSVHPSMELELSIEDEKIPLSRSRDRIWGSVPEAVGPGERVIVEFAMTGSPSRTVYFTGGGHIGSFTRFWRNIQSSGTALTLANNYRLPLVTPQISALPADTLLPVPRFTTWELTPPPTNNFDPGEEVRDESFTVPVQIEGTIQAPFTLVDSCGTFADDGRLSVSCTRALSEFGVMGGEISLLESEQARVVVSRDHLYRTQFHLSGLEETAIRARNEWPEIPPSQPTFLVSDRSIPGNFVHIDTWFLSAKTLRKHPVAEVLQNRLESARVVAPSESEFFQAFWGALADQLDNPIPATLRFVPTDSVPLIELDARRAEGRLKPVVAALLHLLQRDFRVGIGNFLRKSGQGTIEELIEELELASGEELDSFYEDFILGSELPRLEIANLDVARSTDGWTIRGAVTNSGSGEARCPVVLRTDVDSIEERVIVDGGESADFVFRTRQKPRSVTIDPEARCYRLGGPGLEAQRIIEL